MTIDVDEILKDFEPAFRKKLERKVLESTVDGLPSMRPMLISCMLMWLHLVYIMFYFAIHGGGMAVMVVRRPYFRVVEHCYSNYPKCLWQERTT